MEKKLSIKDIAKLAGTSVSTVSRILNQKGRYSKETERKVLDVVDKYGYTANTAARSLRNVSTRTVSLMVPDITNEFYARIAYSCETYLHEKGYTLFICNTNEDPEKESVYLNDFVSKDVDGVIAVSYLTEIPKSFQNSRIPIVTLDRIAQGKTDIPSVMNSDEAGAYDLTKLLVDRGCGNIIGLIPAVDDNAEFGRVKGFNNALAEAGLRHPDQYYYLKVSDHSEELGKEKVLDLFGEGRKIDGIFCGSDRLALGADRAAAELGLKVPEDIQIVGFDHTMYSRLAVPPITTLKRNSRELSETACDLLLEQIDNPGRKCESVVIPTEIIERESTKKFSKN